jgi:hypothetical protein
VASGGIAAGIGIVNPRRRVRGEECPGGQLVGVPKPAASVAARAGAARRSRRAA